jgi:hypothetical protein
MEIAMQSFQVGDKAILIETGPISSKETRCLEGLILEQPDNDDLRLQHRRSDRITGAGCAVLLTLFFLVLDGGLIYLIWEFGASDVLAERSGETIVAESFLVFFFIVCPLFGLLFFTVMELSPLGRRLHRAAGGQATPRSWLDSPFVNVPLIGIVGLAIAAFAALSEQTVFSAGFWLELTVVALFGSLAMVGAIIPMAGAMSVLEQLCDSGRVILDRSKGYLYMMGDLGWDERYPVGEVVAVQIAWSPQARKPARYQLNVVRDASEQPRLNLCSYSEHSLAQKAGERVAGFLSIPLLDHVPEPNA